MERAVTGNCRAVCGAGEKLEIGSKVYLSRLDGGQPVRKMDWRCTQNYVKAFAEAERVPLRLSWRVNGFFGELYRVGASEPVEWMEPQTGAVRQCKLSQKYIKCQEIKQQATEDMEEQLRALGYRMKFPMKTADLSRRWCSAYLKIMVADTLMSNLSMMGELEKLGGKCRKSPVKASIEKGRWCSAGPKREVADSVFRNLDRLEKLGGKRHKFPAKAGTHQGRWCSGSLKAAVQDCVTSNLEKTRQNIKLLVISGERRGESAGRSRYNEMEIHRTNATIKAHRLVHQWRPLIDYSEKDVWEVLKRHRVNPHPCYRCGWNRCSCAMCIFSTPSHFAGIREIMPEDYELLRQDEIRLGFTIDNHKNLDTYIEGAQPCVYYGDEAALHSLITGEFLVDDIYVSGDWKYPAGAFHGAEGGPC